MAESATVSIDKLTPAPWSVRVEKLAADYFIALDGDPDGKGTSALAQFLGYYKNDAQANAEFCAMARNAFDVMMRRGWTAERTDPDDKSEERKWYVPWPMSDRKAWPAVWMNGEMYFDDPFTALVEADRWCKEHVEKV